MSVGKLSQLQIDLIMICSSKWNLKMERVAVAGGISHSGVSEVIWDC